MTTISESLVREPLTRIPPETVVEVLRFGESKQLTEAEKGYQEVKKEIFGRETPTGVIEGHVDAALLSNLLGHASAHIDHEKFLHHPRVFGNIATRNAETIFNEAYLALQKGIASASDGVYNRMLWAALGIVIKEHTDMVSSQTFRSRITLATGLDIRDDGLYLVKYTDPDSRKERINQLESACKNSTQQIIAYLKANFPLNDFETSISTLIG